jgi:hypothetical protein
LAAYFAQWAFHVWAWPFGLFHLGEGWFVWCGKVKGHLELFCNFKKTVFGFPLSSFPSFESNCILEGTSHFLDYGS